VIAVCHLLLIVITIVFGVMSYLEDIRFSLHIIPVMIALFFIAYLFYPFRGNKKGLFAYSFRRRIRHDFILVAVSSCMLVSGINFIAFEPINYYAQETAVNVRLMASTSISPYKAPTGKTLKRGVSEIIKRFKIQIKNQLKELKEQRKNGEGEKVAGKVFLIFLLVLFAAGLVGLLGSLSCSISCSGNVALAVIVFFFGTFLIIYLLALGIRAVHGKYKNNRVIQ
jgi:cbb3-type cytochrome oxidase subunit 3